MKKMKKIWLVLIAVIVLLGVGATAYKLEADAYAKKDKIVASGVFVEGIDLSGATKAEVQSTIENYIQSVIEKDDIHLLYQVTAKKMINVADKAVKASDLGAYWSNPEIVDEILQYGNTGTILKRYKERKELEEIPVEINVQIDFDKEAIATYLEKEFAQFDTEVKELSLVRKDGEFQVLDGAIGYEVDIEASANDVITYLAEKWDRKEAQIPLKVVVIEPKGTFEELSEVQDLLGSFTSYYTGSASNKVANIKNGERLINGILMYPGDDFSFDAYAAPYTIDNGYAVGQAYESGRLVDSVGGGICQVSSTLYNAVLRAELEVTMRYNHSMIVGYVPISSDATLAETSGKDFRFRNNLDMPIYIEAYTTKDHRLVVNIYGKETRAANRTVEYISETLEVINPPADVIKTDDNLPVGHIDVSSAYTGYKAKLWKVVKVDGVEQSKELVNSSNYRAVARMATVGMNTADAAVLQVMNEAVASGNIDHVKNVIASLSAR